MLWDENTKKDPQIQIGHKQLPDLMVIYYQLDP